MDYDTSKYSRVTTLKELRLGFSTEAGQFYDFFFNEGSKEVNDFLGLDLMTTEIFFDENNNPTKAVLKTIFPQNTQTFDGRVHGGMVAAALDIIMGVPLMFPMLLPEGQIAVSKELSKIEIFYPILTNESLSIEATCEKNEGRKFWMTALIKREEQILAKAEGFFLSVPMSIK